MEGFLRSGQADKAEAFGKFIESGQTQEAMTQVIAIMQQRINEMGLTEPLIQQESTEAITQIGLVAAGMGVAILPEQLASVHLPGAVHVPISDGNAVVSMALAYRQADNNQIVQEWLRIAGLHSQKRQSD